MSPSAGDLPSWGVDPNAGWGPPNPGPAFDGSVPLSAPAPAGWLGQAPTGAPVELGGPVSAPVLWLGLVATLEVIGTVLGLLSADAPTLSVLGWLIGGFGAIAGLAWFTLADSARRTSTWYSSTAAPGTVRAVLAGLAIAVVALNAAQFADWASRR